MSPQEIGILVGSLIVAFYLLAGWISRARGGPERADIILETRIPPSRKGRKAKAGAASVGNAKRPKRKRTRATVQAKSTTESSAPGTQKHHGSPTRAAAKRGRKVAAKKPKSEAATAKTKAAETSRPPEVIDPKLTGQISELDERLDAIEELVASIEESLAEFDAVAESDGASEPGEAQAA